MNASAPASGCQFGQHMVDQRPRFENQKLFKKRTKPGRPSKKQSKQYWLK